MSEWKECPKCKCLNKGREQCVDCGNDLRDVVAEERMPPSTVDHKPELAPASGCASRSELLVLRYKELQLRMCDQMLTKACVPEWVMLTTNDSVPSNSTPCRLQWYLARRKDVSESEIDKELLRDMEANLRAAQPRHNNRTEP